MDISESNLPIESHGNGETFHHVISIEEAQEWIASMENKTREVPKLLNKKAGNPSCCIFRVPQSFVGINEKAYMPQIVSIGPYHHGKEHLKMIEEHKWRYLGTILARTRDRGIGLNELFNAIAPLEDKIRESYSENIEYDKPKFIELMILDGCFIIEVLCIVGRLVKPDDLDDPIFSMSWMFSFLLRDFLRLENQIPFFVLESLFELIILRSTATPSLNELALHFFDFAVERPKKVLEKYKDLKGKHLLDLFRLTFIPQSEQNHTVETFLNIWKKALFCFSGPTRHEFSQQNPPDNGDSQFVQLIHSAKKLRLSGIKFKARKAESFLEINFKHGNLGIPPLIMDDFLSYFLLNCIAFEQCYKRCPNYITSYVAFMNCLINSPADAGYLQDHRIIENFYGNDEDVAKFFNDTGKDMPFDLRRSYLLEVFEDVNKYYKDPFNIKLAGFKHTYFESPWSFMSAMAVLIALLLTFIQAFFAAYPYINPSHKPSD